MQSAAPTRARLIAPSTPHPRAESATPTRGRLIAPSPPRCIIACAEAQLPHAPACLLRRRRATSSQLRHTTACLLPPPGIFRVCSPALSRSARGTGTTATLTLENTTHVLYSDSSEYIQFFFARRYTFRVCSLLEEKLQSIESELHAN
jgi:hypothetical protein